LISFSLSFAVETREESEETLEASEESPDEIIVAERGLVPLGAPQHFLYFLPEPHGHGSFLFGFVMASIIA